MIQSENKDPSRKEEKTQEPSEEQIKTFLNFEISEFIRMK